MFFRKLTKTQTHFYKLIVYYKDDTDEHDHYDTFFLTCSNEEAQSILKNFVVTNKLYFFANNSPEFTNRYVSINGDIVGRVCIYRDE